MASSFTEAEATVTIRLIRSFEHANWKPLVIHNLNLQLTTEKLMSHIYEILPSSKLSPPFKTHKGYDTLKVETHRFGYKTNDPLINTADDEKLILIPKRTLLDQGVEHETEISFFNMLDYTNYKLSKSKS